MFTWSWRLTKVSLRELNLCLVSCATFQRNQCNISLKTRKGQPRGGARGNVRRSPQWAGFTLQAGWISVQTFMDIHPVFVDIFQSGPKWWNEPDQQTIHHPYIPALTRLLCWCVSSDGQEVFTGCWTASVTNSWDQNKKTFQACLQEQAARSKLISCVHQWREPQRSLTHFLD